MNAHYFNAARASFPRKREALYSESWSSIFALAMKIKMDDQTFVC
jgi:hypothetical protein